MNGYLLDTDICIHYFKDQFKLVQKIESVGIENCFVSEITVAELTFGAYHSANFNKHINEVVQLKQLFDVLPIFEAIDKYGSERSRLRKAGQLIPDFDLLIGTTAVTLDLIMVTKNEKHLSRISNIQIENWTKKQWNEFIG
ncbi:MAG: type II toxin-antitoxin system VapC family toxin [Saprospiraceae bacterium]